jgi:hypothetical protein
MILARSSPDLSQEDEAARAASPGDECAPVDSAPNDHDPAEAPSFRPLRRPPTDASETSEKASHWKERLDVRAIMTSDPRAVASSSIGAGTVAERPARAQVEGLQNRVPGLVGPSRHILLLCCVFLSGVAAGLGGARLAGGIIGFQDVRTALSSAPIAVAGVTGAITANPVPSETLFPTGASVGPSGRPEVPVLQDDPAPSPGPFANGNEFSAPTEASDHSIAEPRQQSPPGDDAAKAIYQGGGILSDQHPEQPLSSATDARASGYSGQGESHGGLSTPDPVRPEAAPGEADGDHPAEEVRFPADAAFVSLGLMRGDEAMARGDIVAARRFYELAASYRSASAATAVGRTYDPIYLKELGVRGLQPDAEKAGSWYERAQQQGDGEARARLRRLLDAMERTTSRSR